MSEVQKEYNDKLKKEVEKDINTRVEITNRRGNIVLPRKHHMTERDVDKLKKRFDNIVKDVSEETKKKAGERFFNPYRQAGIYFGCVQSLYLLGSNEWHECSKVFVKISEIMSLVFDRYGRSSWEKFINKLPRQLGGVYSVTSKDEYGRIQQNFKVLQRLGGIHPYGLKLAQVGACIDIKREKDGRYWYRLNTSFDDGSKPIYDISAYPKPKRIKREVEVIKLEKEEVERTAKDPNFSAKN